MKQIIIIIIAIFISLFSMSCGIQCVHGSGEVVTKSIEVKEFDKIDIACSADVIVSYGSVAKVEVKGQSNIIDLLTTSVSHGEWEIDFKESVCINKTFTIYITTPSLEKLTINGSGDITGKSMFRQENFEISINGSGDVDYQVETESVGVSINGSGDVDLKGKSKSLEIEINGSGDVHASGLDVFSCSVIVSGSGNSSVRVNQSLDAQVQGSGDIYYYGNPGKINISENGSGDVIKK